MVEYDHNKEISKEAKNYLNAILTKWNLPEITGEEDIGIDYFLTVVDKTMVDGVTKNLTTNTECLIQLKGTETPNYLKDNSCISISIASKNLNTYLVQHIPVFLCVVDVKDKSNKTGYYLFLQKYIAENMQPSLWKPKVKYAVRVPLVNKIENMDVFKSAIQEAQKYVAAKFPDVAKTALRLKEEEFTRLDPRLALKLHIDDNGIEHGVFSAREIVNLTLDFGCKPDDTLKSKIDDLVNRGLEVDLSDYNTRWKGSPALEKQDRIIKIKAGIQIEVSISLVALDKDGKEIARTDPVVGKLEGGRTEHRYKFDFANGFISFMFVMHDNSKEMNMSSSFSLSPWEGTDVNNLPSFNSLSAVVGLNANADSYKFELIHPEIKNISIGMSEEPTEYFAQLRDIITTLEKARFIARELGITLHCPSEITPENFNSIKNIYKLITGGELTIKGEDIKVATKMDADKLSLLLEKISEANPDNTPSSMPYYLQDSKETLWGTEFILHNVEQVIHGVWPMGDIKDYKAQIDSGISPIKVEFRSTKNAFRTIKLVNDLPELEI